VEPGAGDDDDNSDDGDIDDENDNDNDDNDTTVEPGAGWCSIKIVPIKFGANTVL